MTRRIHAIAALALVAALLLAPAGGAAAQEEGGDTGTTVNTVTFEPGREPAVVVSEPSPAADDPAWTFRYLVPTLLVVTGVALAGVAVWYGLGVKGRYRVVR